MSFKFVKLHGLGNDFVNVDARDYDLSNDEWRQKAIAWCDRHFGIGADGLLLAWPSETADVRMQIYNPDGSIAEMCGNGIRTFTKFLVDSGRYSSPQNAITVETDAGNLPIRYAMGEGGVDQVTVNMGPPYLDAPSLPVVEAWTRPSGRLLAADLDLAGRQIHVALVSMGNPHAIAFIDEPVTEFPLAELGPLVENHPAFPRRINFEIVNRHDEVLDTRVWERGAGLTLACGTGACAVTVADQLLTGRNGPRTVRLPGGDLRIEWDGRGDVWMTGPATEVFRGEVR